MTQIIRQPLLEQIEDSTVRDSLQWVIDYLRAQPVLLTGFQHFNMNFKKAETNLEIPHRLAFIPLDIIMTFSTGAGTVSFQYDSFTETNLVISTTGACTIRFFAGRYQDGG